MSNTLKVALVGYGFVGKVFHAPLISAVDGMELYRVVSSNPTAVCVDYPHVSISATLNEALADPHVDVVVIATPNVLHAPQAHAALSAGKHVVVDKPFTITVAEADALIEHAAQAGRLLSVFHNRRYDADFTTLRALIDEGALGEVTQFESHFDRFRPDVRDRWRERAGAGSGLWYDLGPHLIDQALQLFGAPIGITADIAVQRDGGESDDYFHVTLRYERRRVILHASTLMAANDLRFSVHGTRGSFIKHGQDSQEDALKAGRTPGDSTWGEDAHPGTLTTPGGELSTTRIVRGVTGNYCRYYEALRDAILGLAANPVTADEARDVMRLIALGLQSSSERREALVAVQASAFHM